MRLSIVCFVVDLLDPNAPQIEVGCSDTQTRTKRKRRFCEGNSDCRAMKKRRCSALLQRLEDEYKRLDEKLEKIKKEKKALQVRIREEKAARSIELKLRDVVRVPFAPGHFLEKTSAYLKRAHTLKVTLDHVVDVPYEVCGVILEFEQLFFKGRQLQLQLGGEWRTVTIAHGETNDKHVLPMAEDTEPSERKYVLLHVSRFVDSRKNMPIDAYSVWMPIDSPDIDEPGTHSTSNA